MASKLTRSPSVTLPFLMFMSLLSCTSTAMRPLCHDDERTALLSCTSTAMRPLSLLSCTSTAIKQSFYIKRFASGYPFAYPKVASWKNNESKSDCCLWDGVECDEHTGHVVGLDLSSSLLYGSVNSSSSLFHLVHLQKLNLGDNHFNFSHIPTKIARLSMLTSLDLSYSVFYGQIPLEITQLSNLTSLDLGDNVNYSGGSLLELKRFDLAKLVQNLTSLQKLDLSRVDISSAMPDIFTNLSSLIFLNLQSCGLWGPVPPSLGDLINLEYLDLDRNNLSGQIPSSLAHLTKLTHLYLDRNNFFGHIPPWLANLTHLNELSLSYNNFISGSFYWLGNLFELKYLELETLNIVGEIPSSLKNLTHLRVLDLFDNYFTGQIPLWLSNFTQLTELHLNFNELNGSIPESISKLVNLDKLKLGSNYFTGGVKFDMFCGQKNLLLLDLGGNNLSIGNVNVNCTLPRFEILLLGDCNLSEFPNFLRQQNQLRILDLLGNKLQGRIPKWIGNISKETLGFLRLEENFLTGFEDSSVFSHLTELESLDLRSNNLQGPLPIPPPSIAAYWVSANSLSGEISPWMCNLPNLLYLDLSSNKLSGMIPKCFDNFSNSLVTLNLANNSLSGSIPETFINGSNLRWLDLSQNRLEGQLPRSLASCGMLETLDVSENRISDEFPFWLGTLPNLEILVLRSNQFFGILESPAAAFWFPKVRIIDLSHNNFVGLLPSEFFRTFNSLKTFDVDEFAYRLRENTLNLKAVSITIMVQYQVNLANKGLYRNYQKVPNVLAAVDLSSNKFRGEIPVSIGTLKMINVLNLSNNHFSGHILSSLGDLTRLESLDLSQNMLSGEIPSEMSQLTFLEYLNVSGNQLVGRIPEGKQFNTFENSSYEGNAGLCGNPLSKKCENSGEPPRDAHPTSEKGGDTGFSIEWIVVLIGYGGGVAVGVVAGLDFAARKQEWLLETFGWTQRGARRKRSTRAH